jgi:hypothetical protein
MSWQMSEGVVLDLEGAALFAVSAREVLAELSSVAEDAGLEVFGLWRATPGEDPPALSARGAACVGVGRTRESGAPADVAVPELAALARRLGARWPTTTLSAVMTRCTPPLPAEAWRARLAEAWVWEASWAEGSLEVFAAGREAVREQDLDAVRRWLQDQGRPGALSQILDALGWLRVRPPPDAPDKELLLLEAFCESCRALDHRLLPDARIALNALWHAVHRPVRPSLSPNGVVDWVARARYGPLRHPAETGSGPNVHWHLAPPSPLDEPGAGAPGPAR